MHVTCLRRAGGRVKREALIAVANSIVILTTKR
jgi:hypothetical protein